MQDQGASPRRDITRNLLAASATIRAVLERLNEGVSGIVLLVDGAGALAGVMTDGDVRRALLAGASFEAPAADWMNRRFTTGSVHETKAEHLEKLSGVIRHLPIVSDDRKPVDLLCWRDISRLPLVSPSLSGNEMAYVMDCISTGWISSQGQYIKDFEARFSEYLGGEPDCAAAVSSGTAALHLAIIALGIGPGDEVIVPDITFGATANVVMHAGATPVLVDVDPISWTISPSAIESAITDRTRAIIPVHIYGHPCDMNAIMALAETHDLLVIEDCAESLGAKVGGIPTGTFGHVAAYSFFANKVITTGEGGMVYCRDQAVLDRIRMLRDHGMSRERRYWHLMPGFNYRMTNLQAAVGLAQMERIDDFLLHREEMADAYGRNLQSVAGLTLPAKPNWGHNIFWLYTIVVDPGSFGKTRDQLMGALDRAGIETRPLFPPLHAQPVWDDGQPQRFPISIWLGENGLSLPMGNTLRKEDIDEICQTIRGMSRSGLPVQHGDALT